MYQFVRSFRDSRNLIVQDIEIKRSSGSGNFQSQKIDLMNNRAFIKNVQR